MSCFSFAGIALVVTACASSPARPPAPPSPQASTPVFDAIRARDPAALARVLDGDSRLASAHDGDGISATLAALFQINADGETFASPQDNPLLRVVVAHHPALDVFDAAAVGDVARLRTLLAGDRALAGAFHPALGVTPLHLAAFAGRLPAMELLLASGAGVDVVSHNSFHNTPLILATLTSQHEAATRLLAKGADPNFSEKGGERPLHIAAAADDVAMIRLLVEHGAAKDVTTEAGQTPLEVARTKHAAHAQAALDSPATP